MYLEVIAVLHYNKHDAVFHACVLRTYRPVTRFQYLEGHNAFLGGKIFAFTLCLKQIFLGATKFGGKKGNFWGALPPNDLPWLRACVLILVFSHVFVCTLWLRCMFEVQRLVCWGEDDTQ